MTDLLLTEEHILANEGFEILHVSYNTGVNYMKKGCRGRDGQIHKLEFLKVGKRLYTSREAASRFLRAINTPAANGTDSSTAQGGRTAQSPKAELVATGAL